MVVTGSFITKNLSLVHCSQQQAGIHQSILFARGKTGKDHHGALFLKGREGTWEIPSTRGKLRKLLPAGMKQGRNEVFPHEQTTNKQAANPKSDPGGEVENNARDEPSNSSCLLRRR